MEKQRENGIYSITRYKHRPYPKEKVETRYNENIIGREFKVDEPNKAWCGDITYIKTASGWVYLAAVIDLFNREVVGYSFSKKATTELAKRAMANALVNRKPSERLIFHSDRDLEQLDSSLFEYIELFYNRKRMHSSLDNQTPREYYLKYIMRKPV